MDNININSNDYKIKEDCLENICIDFKNRIIKILFLKDDVESGKIKEYDMFSYIETLGWDIYGVYTLFNKYKLISCLSELVGIKNNVYQPIARKKILDLANYIEKIPHIE